LGLAQEPALRAGSGACAVNSSAAGGRICRRANSLRPKAVQSRRVPAGACPGGRKPGYEAQKAELEKRL